jgi:hypothetical protein
MSSRDYFAFCTSLKPIELKALGGLSQVRHLAAGETIYSAGDPATSLYIISRGVIEIVAEAPEDAGTGTFLSRGDVLGDVELLTATPRKYTARTSKRRACNASRGRRSPSCCKPSRRFSVTSAISWRFGSCTRAMRWCHNPSPWSSAAAWRISISSRFTRRSSTRHKPVS